MAGESEKEKKEPQGLWTLAVGVISTVYHAVMRSGAIQAAFFQGVSELGQALKAFPDSIQVQEAGTVFNPYYSDRMEDRKAHAHEPSAPVKDQPKTPGEIARSNAPGSVHGESQPMSKDPLPSAGEIANDRQQTQLPQPEQGQEKGKEQGMSL